MDLGAGVPEWPKGAGLGPAGQVLRGFEPHPPHFRLNSPLFAPAEHHILVRRGADEFEPRSNRARDASFKIESIPAKLRCRVCGEEWRFSPDALGGGVRGDTLRAGDGTHLPEVPRMLEPRLRGRGGEGRLARQRQRGETRWLTDRFEAGPADTGRPAPDPQSITSHATPVSPRGCIVFNILLPLIRG